MDSLHVVTSRGALSLVGRLQASPRPALLVIGGAFAPTLFKHEFVDRYLGATVLVGRLPGMDSPWLSEPGPEGVAAAFDEAVARLLPTAPVVVYGISTGCLVSARMKASNIVHQVMEEPFFSTAELWPIVEMFRDRIRGLSQPRGLQEFLWEFFGLGETSFPGRCHRHLINEISVPTDVVVGGIPLEPERIMDGWPSLTSVIDRQLLAANPLVTLHDDGNKFGHAFGLSQPGMTKIDKLVLGALRTAVASLPKGPAATDR